MTIHVCKDDPNRINKLAKAEVVKAGEDKTSLKLPSGAAATSRGSSPAVIAVERQIGEGLDVEVGGSCDMAQVVRPENTQEGKHPVGEMHKDASVTHGIEAMAVTHAPNEPEHSVGVQPTVRAVAHLGAHNPPQPQAAAQAVPARPPARQDVAPLPPAQPPVQVQEPQLGEQTMPRPKKTRVVLESARMGRHRIRVDKYAVSDTMVVLGYIDDDDAAIVEPPVAEGQDDVVRVTLEQTTYTCLYYGFTFEMQVDGHPMLMVALVLVDK